MESPPAIPPIRFTRYEAEFLEPMLALHRSAMAGLTVGLRREREEADLMAIEHYYLRGGGEFLLGFVDGQLIAMGGFMRENEDTAELKRMAVDPRFQGRGYGRALLLELEKRATEAGMHHLRLETPLARHFTLAFYRRHGYEESGRGYYGNVETVQFKKVTSNQ